MSSAAGAVSLGYELIKIAKREGWFEDALDYFRTKHKVLLLGSSGVGKTQFGDSINNPQSTPLSIANRTEFANEGRYDIGGLLFELTDTPGQLEHQERRRRALAKSIREGFGGVANFVCYGYHEYGVPAASVLKDEGVILEYLSEHRQKEIELLSEWATVMTSEWVLTVVTKADIWWDSREEVLDYYTKGPYAHRIQNLFPGSIHIVRPYSSLSERFYGKIGGSSEFGDKTRRDMRNEVLRVFTESTRQIGGK